MTMYDSVTYHT